MLAVAVLLWMGALCVYDVRQRRLPNALTVPGAAVILFGALAAAAGAGAGRRGRVGRRVPAGAPGDSGGDGRR
ncbi:type IV leader peptidase family protein [Mycobacterium kansasii]|uniref:Type IV leader peptidase family protein n=1 Tax=Mycobacterium kansasii TaxID=1768 RepID=A0A1V3WD48_MYCKA|nr:type IV leader peptidase family protein [Mycobacterium kansasii]